MRRKNASYAGLSFHRREKKKFDMSLLYEILTWGFGILVSAFLGVMLVYFFGFKVSVIGSAMEPALTNAQTVLINKVAYQFSSPKRGDVVAFYPNGNTNTHLYIRRVVGLPGETVSIHDGFVFINGIRYFDDTADYTEDGGIANTELTLELGEYFVMCDNRDNLEDSRNANIGNVTKEMIRGKAWYHLGNTKDKRGKIE